MDALVARDLTRSTLAVLFIAGMIVASFWVLRPFVPAAIWATMIVVASWPLMVRVQSMLWGRRGLAVAVMTVLLLLGLLLPLALALTTIVAHSQDIADGVQWLATWSVPPPPDWLERLPLLGSRLVARWKDAAAIRTEDVSASLLLLADQVTARWAPANATGAGIARTVIILLVPLNLAALAWMPDRGSPWRRVRLWAVLITAQAAVVAALFVPDVAAAARAFWRAIAATAPLQWSVVSPSGSPWPWSPSAS